MDSTRRRLISGTCRTALTAVVAPSVLANAILESGARSPAVRLVVNDLYPAFVPAAMPYRLLSCKDLVGIRNAYVGYTTSQVLASPQMDSLYAQMRTMHLSRHAELQAAIEQLEIDIAAADKEVRKEQMDLVIGFAFAAGAVFAGMLATTWPVIGLFAITAVTVVQLGYYTLQLFQIEDESGALDAVISFNDSKMGALSFMAKQLKDVNASKALERINGRSWGLLGHLLTANSFYSWYSGKERRDKLIELLASTKRDYQSLKSELDLVLKSKQDFVEYVRVVSAEGAATAEKLWRAASLNQCGIAGTVKLSTILKPSSNKILRPLP